MALQLRKGTDDSRQQLTIPLQLGELIYTTDTKQLYIGDGSSTIGINILATSAGVGLVWNSSSQKLDISSSNLTSGQITESSNSNLFFTEQRAQDAAAYLFTRGDGTSFHNGLSFEYDSTNHKLVGTVTSALSADTAPSLGGNLDLNNNSITGTGDINFSGLFNNQYITISNTLINAGTQSLVTKSTNVQSLIVKAELPATVTTEADIPHLAISVAGHSSTALASTNKVGGIMFKGLTSTANNFKTVGGIYATLIANSDIETACPSSNVKVITGAKNQAGYNTFTFDHNGAFSAPIFKAASYTTGSYPGSVFNDAEAGWIIFNSQTAKFMGYNGTAWVELG